MLTSLHTSHETRLYLIFAPHINGWLLVIITAADDDVRLARRIQRDVQRRGRNIESVLEQYQRFVKPAFDKFVAPSRR